ncbi:MAG: DUF1178 family protein [Desulfobacteraceae bacterium]|nr:MAG: DUF1178 family protein [Desulfobacteraceae bacterium]
MIAFDLKCANGHIFEGWFEDSRAFEGQKKKNLISCPICNNISVFKIPTKFAIKSSGNSTTPSGKEVALAEIKKKVAEFVENNFDNVGTEFAAEALKIHYGVSEPRNIRGVSTSLEEKTLKEEGIPFFKVPVPAPPETDS